MVGQRALTISSGDEAERPSRKITSLPEEIVLYPYSKELHEDDWPCFVLSGAVVYGKDGKTPVNLLHAELEGPMLIRGRLEVDKEFRHLRKITSPRCPEVVVKNVKCFSISTGPVTIWAMGQAGWFEIRPSVTYQSIFKKMVEGVSLYYFLADFYEARKTAAGDKSINMDQIFKQYSKQLDKSMTTAQVASRCEEHAIFLLSQMRKIDNTTRWPRTSFYRWLVDKCPEIHYKYQGKSNEKSSRARKSSSVTERASLVEAQDNRTSPKMPGPKKHGNGKDISHGVRVLPLVGRRRKRSSESDEDENSMHAKQNLECRISSPKSKAMDKGKGKEILMDETPPLMPASPEAGSQSSRSDTTHTFATQSKLSSEEIPVSNTSASHQGLRRGPPRLSGKVAKLRLAGTSITRAQMTGLPSDEEDAEPGPSRKRPNTALSSVNDDSEVTHSSNETASDPELAPFGGEDESDAKDVLMMISEPIPSASPKGPNGLWECEKDGCDFYVPAADKPEGRAMAQAHLLQHADEIEARENLVREESRPYLSINHLLEKLRGMGEAARVAEEQKIGGRVIPQPIKRRLAV